MSSKAPDRIWATVNGARFVMPGGDSYLVGKWEWHGNSADVEYVRADLADDLTTAYLAGHRDGVDKIAAAQKAFAECALSALTSIAANTCCDGCQEAAKVAKKALSAMGVRADSSQKDAERPPAVEEPATCERWFERWVQAYSQSSRAKVSVAYEKMADAFDAGWIARRDLSSTTKPDGDAA